MTYPTSGDETDFLSWHGRPSDSRSFADMLVVTTTVRMVHGVHSDTTSAGPVVTLGLVFVERTTSLEEGLIHSATTSHNTDCCARAAADRLLRTRGELDARLVLIRAMIDDGCFVARGASKGTTDAGRSSTLQTIAPSGSCATGRTFPTARVAFLPQ